MIISKRFTAKCVACEKTLHLFEYEGLEGGLYGSRCPCPELRQYQLDHPRRWKFFKNLKFQSFS